MSSDLTAGAAPSRRVSFAALGTLWSRVWFQDKPTTPLEITRIGIGAAMLLHYALATPYLFLFWGNDGWMPRSRFGGPDADVWVQSVFFYFNATWQWAVFHAVFLFCCAALMLGWRTRWVKWLVLIGHISYDQRNTTLVYGVDAILACLLVILCFAPTGRALSLDRVRDVRRAKRQDLDANVPQFTSRWAGACVRLMQVQMAVLFYVSATDKMTGADWQMGDAVWRVFSHTDYYNALMLDVLASQPWMITVASYGTIAIELFYVVFIWPRWTRPIALAGAIFLHSQFALLMRLYYFSFVMTMGHMSFVRPEWLHRLGTAWKRRVGNMEMIYDGHCGFCKRSMAAFLAFDGLRQISIRDYRANPSPVVPSEKVDKALYLVLPDGRALPGFDAYRHVVLRVPGMWWMVPLFYIPVLSRLVGRPLYNWIASHRSVLSKYA
ncbi:MAG: DCC1-like thiol-disulfide oxidoreductase family protein [Variibacter sp.]